ncbi:MAG: hypothetical protein IMZ58_10485 [Thermoplasmata archaeon]|nr:hypothetical protein [Thermoplasmata archaeon]
MFDDNELCILKMSLENSIISALNERYGDNGKNVLNLYMKIYSSLEKNF